MNAPNFMQSVGGGIAAVINTPVHDGQGGASNASFSVDIEQIPGLIAKYEEARDKLIRTRETASELEMIAPPGEDPVSGQMAQSLSQMAGPGPNQLGGAVSQAIGRLNDQIEQLKKAQADYNATDEAAM